MTVRELLVRLAEEKVELAVDADELVVRTKSRALDPALIALLRENKQALLEVVRSGGHLPASSADRHVPLLELSEAEMSGIAAAVAGGAGNVQDVYPLAPLQEGILFHHLMTPEGDPYLLSSLSAFDSRERLDAYVAALQAVVARHDVLRTSVMWEGLSEPMQVVWREVRLEVEEVEPDPAGGDVARQLHRRFGPRRNRLDVRRAPLMRLYAARDAARDRWVLLRQHHHLIGDHVTFEVLKDEVRAHLLGRSHELPAPLPFRSYVAQARLGVNRAEHESYFRELLGDVDEPTAPYGLLDAWGDGSGIAEARVPVDGGLAARLRARARKLGVSAASVCHVAWALVLARVSGRRDVVFGTVLFGRMQGGAGAGRVLGPFVNTLPVRVRVASEGAETGVRRTHRQLVELLRHEHASLALAQRSSGVQAPTPLFTSLLNYRHGGSAAGASRSAEGNGSRAGVREIHGEERTNYPVALSVDDWGEGFGLTAQVPASVGPERVCAMMHRALESMVEALEAAPERPMDQLEVLAEEERRQLLEAWNRTASAYPGEVGVHELFAAQAGRTPGAVAVVQGERTLTYAELDAWAHGLAQHLRQRGVRAGSRVALLLPRSVELVVAELAVLRAGAAYVPLDASYPAERTAFMIADSGARLLLSRSGEPLAPLPGVDRVDVDTLSGAGAAGVAGELDAAGGLGGEALAYVMYTSGSTGEPKGVMVPHRAITQLVLSNGYADLDAEDRVALASNPAFDASTLEVWGPLLRGGRIVVVGQEVLLDAPEYGRLLEEAGVTALLITPVLFNHYAQVIPGALSGLRYVLTGGDRAAPAAYARVLGEGGRVRIYNCYGPTETTTFSLAHGVEVGEAMEGGRGIPIGRPKGNTRAYVLDGSGAPVPVGVVGELYVGGAGVALGYWGRAGLTAEKFVPDGLGGAAGGRLYRTGDLVRWRGEGEVEFVGRNDFQVKVRGFRIELSEIEARLGEHGGVEEAVVVAREEGAGEKRLVAYYVGDAGVEALRGHLGDRVAEYMVPGAYVRLAALPRTPNGKVDRRGLPAPEGDAYARRGYEAPVGETEGVLAQIWAEVLGVERVGRHDHFFELGGHSLLAVKLVSRIRQRLGGDVALADLFSHPTVESLATLMRGDGGRVRDDRAIPVRPTGSKSPLFLVHEGAGSVAYAWVLQPHIDAEIPVFALPATAASGPRLRTVEGMATRLVRMLREVQPVGPYRLAGWSFGGVLAYEMASQLIGQDQAVEFVGMMDTYHPAVARSRAEDPGRDYALLLGVLRMAEAPGGSTGPRIGEQAAAPGTDMETFVRRCREKGLLPDHVTAAQAQEMQDRVSANRRALREYFPHPLPLPVHLFPAQESTDPDLQRGWQALAGDAPTRLSPVPGTHLSMMEARNVRSLGEALSREVGLAAEHREALPEEAYSPLVTLRFGKAGGVPLFCVPGAGASVASFAELGGYLDPARPIHAFQPRGLDGDMVPHSTVAAAAEHYLRALHDAQPTGPVHLLGHSFGGWVAFEMALRLRGAGRTVGSLTILDSEVPDEEGGHIAEYDGGEAFLKLVEVFELTAERPLEIGAEEIAVLDEAGRLELLHGRLVRLGLLPRRSAPEVLRGPFRTFSSCLRATYWPDEIYPASLRLVLLRDSRYDSGANQSHSVKAVQGWKRWAPALSFLVGAGNHMTALNSPNVRDLASHFTTDVVPGP